MSTKASESSPIKVRLIYGLMWTFAKLPLWFSQVFMSLLARLAILINSRAYHVSKINISICFPELSEKEQQALVKKSLSHTFKIAPEIAKAWFKSDINNWIENVYGVESIQQDLAQGKGILITGSHIGNWEVALYYLGANFKFSCMYRKPRQQELDQVMTKGRGKNKTKMLPGNGKGLREFLKALKAGEMAALLSDQEPGTDTGLFVPFFGKKAKTMDLIQSMQKRTAAKVYQVAAIKNENGKYDIYLPELEINPELSMDEYATQLNLELESFIKKFPEQYQWSYKRFKTTEDGSPNPYTK